MFSHLWHISQPSLVRLAAQIDQRSRRHRACSPPLWVARESPPCQGQGADRPAMGASETMRGGFLPWRIPSHHGASIRSHGFWWLGWFWGIPPFWETCKWKNGCRTLEETRIGRKHGELHQGPWWFSLISLHFERARRAISPTAYYMNNKSEFGSILYSMNIVSGCLWHPILGCMFGLMLRQRSIINILACFPQAASRKSAYWVSKLH